MWSAWCEAMSQLMQELLVNVIVFKTVNPANRAHTKLQLLRNGLFEFRQISDGAQRRLGHLVQSGSLSFFERAQPVLKWHQRYHEHLRLLLALIASCQIGRASCRERV